ncbi:MAG: tetratricopeptide repeat protein [Crocinitomicaceae bacterium]|nr:tetratricopeptide repeat protein [Crocinitomicaceae bacterium]
MRILFFSLLLWVAVPVNAQDDLDLAEYYYNQGMIEQAKLYYEKLYKSNKTNRVYTNYLGTLIGLNDFDEAEKLVKKKIKSESDDGVAYLQLGDLYKKFNKTKEAQQQFELAVSKVKATRSNIIRLANEFTRINEYEYALRTYEKGKSSSQDGYNFAFEIANTKGILGDYNGMIEAFLDLVGEEASYLQTVQNSLNRTLNFDENPSNLELLRVQLLKRVQKFPDKTVFNEMLVWLFLQKKDFTSAFIQVSALDKRLNESGGRMINLASLAGSNKDYETAKKAYQYVIDKGAASPYYITARIEKLQIMSAELADKPGINKEAYLQLENDYLITLGEVGRNAETAIMMKELAHIEAFHLDKTEEAAQILREAIDIPGLYPKTQAICKLELADVYLFTGEIWDASLLYSQVELDFKEDALGHEAKFRNAKISYYTGDFAWAQGQLDVLKASTTKLISNDAIELSLLITDNFNMDTITAPMEMYARADLLAYQNKFDAAMTTVDSILTEYPYHSLTDDIYMMKGNLYYRQAQFDSARSYYQKILDFHFKDITADDALFKLAGMNQYIFNDTAKAMELYEKLITDYPGSLFVVEARKRFRLLRGDAIE